MIRPLLLAAAIEATCEAAILTRRWRRKVAYIAAVAGGEG